MRVIFTDGHKEFMCMQSSKRAATHSQDQSDRLLHVILTVFFFFCRGLCCLTGHTVITKWYGFPSRCAMNFEGNWCFSPPLETHPSTTTATFFSALCLGYNSNFLKTPNWLHLQSLLIGYCTLSTNFLWAKTNETRIWPLSQSFCF